MILIGDKNKVSEALIKLLKEMYRDLLQHVYTAGKPGVFREVCFVRLLSLVVNKSDISFTASLKNHPSLPFLTV